MADTTRQVFLASRPTNRATLSDFGLRDVPLRSPADGELLLKGCFLSLDPYMRGMMDDRDSYTKPVNVGDVMPGEAVCVVESSRHHAYKTGDVVLALTGWQSKCVCGPSNLRKVDTQIAPMSAYLGVLGMPGFTAYAGMRAIGKPVKGETVVVSAAAGAVGSMVGQLATIAGATAIGISGGPKKCALVQEEFGFEAAVDYQATHFREALAKACPRGVDVYFENVGGDVWQAVLPLLNQFARVPVCGLVAHYDAAASADTNLLPEAMRQILARRLTLRGFINFDYEKDYHAEFLRDVSGWLKEGRIHHREHIVDGIESAPKAFIGMLKGENFGKTLVHLS